MAFELKNVVPWGRDLAEYRAMFSLQDEELDTRIISIGDGPASFNAEMTRLGKKVISLDPVYRFSTAELALRIAQTKDTIIEQMTNNMDKFVWTKINDIQQLEEVRLSAMNLFLADFEQGRKASRYLDHEMPNKIDFKDLAFDLSLSSHFLLLYAQLGLTFHLASITEMLRISKEVRIFPILNLNALRSEVLDGVIKHFESGFDVDIRRVDYEFQKNGNEMLCIKHK